MASETGETESAIASTSEESVNTTTMSILRTNKKGKFFNSTLLPHIMQGTNSDEIRAIVNSIDACQLSDNFGRTLLHIAAKYGNSEITQHLIDTGADVNAQDGIKQTPLMLAVKASKRETVQLLLKASADIFVPDIYGHCPLGETFNDNQQKMSNILPLLLEIVTAKSLSSSKHVTSDIFHQDCPLYHFIRLVDPKINRILIEKGSPVDAAKPLTGDTALHLAADVGSVENVKLLLKHKANVNAKNLRQLTPLACILQCYDYNEIDILEVIKTLIAAGANLFDPESRTLYIERVLQRGTREMVRTVLHYLKDLQFKDAAEKMVIHYLAENQCPNVFDELPNLDFDFNSHCSHMCTPLHYAAKVGNVSSVRFLLDRGVDVNAKTNYDETPLFMAVNRTNLSIQTDFFPGSNYKNYLRSIEILLERGSDPHIYTEKHVEFITLYYPTIHQYYSNEQIQFMMPVLAKLALVEESGQQIQIFMREFIELRPLFKRPFDAFKEELTRLKQVEIINLITLFDLLTFDDRKIYRLTRVPNFVLRLTEVTNDLGTRSYYHRILHRYCSKSRQVIELRETILPVVNEFLRKICHLSLEHIAEKIINILCDEKWRETV